MSSSKDLKSDTVNNVKYHNNQPQENLFDKHLFGNYDKKLRVVRKTMPLWMYWMVLFLETISIFQVILYLYIYPEYIPYVVVMITSVIRTIGFTICTFYLAPWSQIWRIYIIIDAILYAEIGADIGYILYHLYFYVYLNQEWYIIMFIVLLVIVNFSFVGNFRLMMKYARWKPWQVITYKIQKLLTSVFYICISAPLLLDIFSFTNSDSDAARKVDQSIRDLYLLFIIGYFTFIFQMHNTVCDYDGTSDLLPRYTLRSPDSDDQDDDQDEDQFYKNQRNQKEKSVDSNEQLAPQSNIKMMQNKDLGSVQAQQKKQYSLKFQAAQSMESLNSHLYEPKKNDS